MTSRALTIYRSKLPAIIKPTMRAVVRYQLNPQPEDSPWKLIFGVCTFLSVVTYEQFHSWKRKRLRDVQY